MKRFGKKLGAIVLAMSLMLVSAFSVSAASVEAPAEDFFAQPARAASSFPGAVRIKWYVNNNYSLNVYSSASTPANQNDVTVYSTIPGEGLQLWNIQGDYGSTTVRVFVYGTNYCLDCSSTYNTQVYSGSGSGVSLNDQYLKMVNETASLPHLAAQNPTGFVLAKTISSVPRAMHADANVPRQNGWNVNYAVPGADQSSFYWLVVGA